MVSNRLPFAIAKHVPILLRLSQDKRKLLRDAFYKDISFHDHLDSPDYVFCFHLLPDDVREIGKAFLLLFYKRLVDGFYDGTRDQHTFAVTRASVEKGCRAANDEMKMICPACLGLLEEPTKKRSMVDCEHFFPQSLYPPLVVHPNNLVFVCQACNEYHNNDDPMHLDPLAQVEAGALRKTFVPYQRSGFAVKGSGKQHQDKVQLHFDLVNPKNEFINLLGNGKDVFASDRAKNFDRVYGLSERWGKLVPGMYNTLRDPYA